MLHKKELKPNGFRELTEKEVLAVSGGHFDEELSQEYINLRIQIQQMSTLQAAEYLDALVEGGYFPSPMGEEQGLGSDVTGNAAHQGDAAVFYALVSLFAPNDAVAEAFTLLRNVLIDATSLENKAAANQWINDNVQALGKFLFGLPGPDLQGSNPLETYRGMFMHPGTPQFPE